MYLSDCRHCVSLADTLSDTKYSNCAIVFLKAQFWVCRLPFIHLWPAPNYLRIDLFADDTTFYASATTLSDSVGKTSAGSFFLSLIKSASQFQNLAFPWNLYIWILVIQYVAQYPDGLLRSKISATQKRVGNI